MSSSSQSMPFCPECQQPMTWHSARNVSRRMLGILSVEPAADYPGQTWSHFPFTGYDEVP
jgi:hypothetical protein